jgi:hypothetical protein
MTDEAPLATQRLRESATAFAAALDADDWTAAGRRLADECVYERGDEVLRGRAAILGSYAAASAWARNHLDDVRYESEIEAVDGGSATVRFTDYLVKAGGFFHRHRCRQTLFADDAGSFVRIVHHEIPGEREALEGFLRRCGLER